MVLFISRTDSGLTWFENQIQWLIISEEFSTAKSGVQRLSPFLLLCAWHHGLSWAGLLFTVSTPYSPRSKAQLCVYLLLNSTGRRRFSCSHLAEGYHGVSGWFGPKCLFETQTQC